MRQLVLAGVGFARLGLFHVADAIKAGRLVPLLEKYNPGDLEMIHAIYLGGGDVPTRDADALSAASPLAFVPKHGFSVLPASLVKPNVRIAVAEGVAAVTPVAIRRHGGSTRGNARH